MFRTGCILLMTLVALVEPVRAQDRASNWRIFQVIDGLPENGCVSVTIGPRGKVWAGHPKGGITSLDGYNVTNFPGTSGGTGRIFESPVGQFWTVCDDGLKEFRDDKWVHYPVSEIAAHSRARRSESEPIELCPVGLGRALFLLPDQLMHLVVENAETVRTTTLRPVGRSKLEKFLGMTTSSRDGSLWISGARGLAHIGAPARSTKPDSEWSEFILPDSLSVRNLREPVEDEDGGITAVGESTGRPGKVVVHFDGAQGFRAIPVSEAIRLAWRGPDRTLWAASSNSLFQLDERQNELVANEEISVRQIFDVAVEPRGTFWLATSDGLFRYAPPAWQTPVPLRALNSPIHSMAEDAEGRFWITSTASFQSYDSTQVANFRIPENILRDFPGSHSVFALAGGAVVSDAGDRLLCFNPQSSAFVSMLPPQKARVKPVGLLPSGKLCVQVFDVDPARDSALEVFDGTEMAPFPFAQPPRLGNELRLFSSRSGNLWLGGSKGIARYRDQNWQTFSPSDEPAPEGITCMAEISENKIWCGAQDKIWECDGKAWRLVRAGFTRVNAILYWRDGSVWVAADNGLHRFFRSVWAEVGPEEGLPGPVVRDVHEDRRGRIWAVTAMGLALYHPDADPDPPRAYASPEPKNSIIEGSPITISIFGRDKWKYTPVSRVLVAWRLDEQEWTWSQEMRAVTIPDLPPGTHTFRVTSMDRNWNEDPKTSFVEFSVLRPWYKESRLLLISSAGLAVAVFFAALAFNRHLRLMRSYAEVEAQVTLRTRQLEIANQELFHSQKMNALGTLAAGIAHDFNNILSIIKGSAQIIEDNLDNRDKIQVRTSRIKTVVEQGSGIVKAMLGFSRSSGNEVAMCDINSVIAETVQLLGDRFLREVDVRFQPTPALPLVPASKDFVQQILLNLIFNAAEAMTDHRQVILAARESSELPAKVVLPPAKAASFIFVSVKDFGCGIGPDIMPRIFEPFFTTKSLSARRGTGLGLSMVYELARQMECGLAAESTLEQGSVFTLIIPVRDLPLDAKREIS